jgi:hypothetical protein
MNRGETAEKGTGCQNEQMKERKERKEKEKNEKKQGENKTRNRKN